MEDASRIRKEAQFETFLPLKSLSYQFYVAKKSYRIIEYLQQNFKTMLKKTALLARNDGFTYKDHRSQRKNLVFIKKKLLATMASPYIHSLESPSPTCQWKTSSPTGPALHCAGGSRPRSASSLLILFNAIVENLKKHK